MIQNRRLVDLSAKLQQIQTMTLSPSNSDGISIKIRDKQIRRKRIICTTESVIKGSQPFFTKGRGLII
jgi:hypothetical protein